MLKKYLRLASDQITFVFKQTFSSYKANRPSLNQEAAFDFKGVKFYIQFKVIKLSVSERELREAHILFVDVIRYQQDTLIQSGISRSYFLLFPKSCLIS